MFEGNVLGTHIIQAKAGQLVTLTLHPFAKAIIESKKQGGCGHYPEPGGNGRNLNMFGVYIFRSRVIPGRVYIERIGGGANP